MCNLIVDCDVSLGPPVCQEQKLAIDDINAVIVESSEEPSVAEHGDKEDVHEELDEVDKKPGHQEGQEEDHVEDAPFSPVPAHVDWSLFYE